MLYIVYITQNVQLRVLEIHFRSCFFIEETLLKANVKGMKRLHNFIKKEEERQAW